MTVAKLDPIDLKILDAIQRDGRITKLALADKVGLSPTPCWMRLRKLEEAGIISGYHAKVAMRVVAPVAIVLVEVTLASHRQADFDRFERVIRDIPEIVTCWSVGGGVDYVLKVMARDIDAYQRLVDGLLSLFYQPTLLVDVPDEALIMREETFGPVAAVMPFDDEDEVIGRANATEYGLVAYVVTENGGRQQRMGRALDYGMVAINRVKITGGPIPFGGVKQSGIGREGSRHGLEAFTDLKYLCLDVA